MDILAKSEAAHRLNLKKGSGFLIEANSRSIGLDLL
jgi:hypothetical protein